MSEPFSPPEGAAAVLAIVAAARQTWPSLRVSPEAVARHLERVGPESAELWRAHAADLGLAAACAAGDAVAQSVLDREILRQVADFVARIDAASAFGDEVTQAVREKLFMPAAGGRGPKIEEYAGRGPLGGWVRVVAVRVAIDKKRAQEREGGRGQELPDEVVAVALSPELDLLKQSHRGLCQQALDEGFRALTPRERNLLRLHHAEGWSLEKLAEVYKVHRATVARWLSIARDSLLSGMAERLGQSLGLAEDEVGSLVGMLRSQLDLSLTRLGG